MSQKNVIGITITLTMTLNIIFIVISTITGNILHDDPAFVFHEQGLARYFSALQLGVTSGITFLIYRLRSETGDSVSLFSPKMIWILISSGFVFLAADDIFMIHERIDRFLHTLFGIEETGWTDRIDDLIILLYMVVGVGVIWLYRSEMMKFRSIKPVLMAAMLLVVAMIAVDLLTNRNDVLLWLLDDAATTKAAATWAAVLEESLKLLAEAIFIIAALRCLQLADGARASA